MGYSQEAYVAYGVYIPLDPYAQDEAGLLTTEQVDQALSVPTVKIECPEVGHLSAGDLDRDKFFLVTQCDSAELGQYIRLIPNVDTEDWNHQLAHLIDTMGWSGLDLEPPSWFVVSDFS